jgi:hypothetical protein
MGAFGELFGLAVYMGGDGLKTYHDLQAGTVKREDLLYTQDCLLASFEDRKMLDSEDLAVIKQLGLKFRGRNAWPTFRSHVPGYYPWHLNGFETRFLAIAIEQARESALMVRNDDTLVKTVKKGLYPVRIPQTEGNRRVWETQQLKPATPTKQARKEEPPFPMADGDLRQLKKKKVQRGMLWEADLSFSPMPVRVGKGRPFFPHLMLIVDRYSGLVLKCETLPHLESRTGFRKTVWDLLQRGDSLPEQVLFSKRELQELVDPVLRPLNITSRLVKRLDAIEDARKSLFEFMTR